MLSADGMVAPYAGPVAMKLSVAVSRAAGTAVCSANSAISASATPPERRVSSTIRMCWQPCTAASSPASGSGDSQRRSMIRVSIPAAVRRGSAWCDR